MDAPWNQAGSPVTKEDKDSLERLIEFDRKHNYYKALHFKLMMFLITILIFTMTKYYFHFSFFPGLNPVVDFIFNDRNIIMDLFLNIALLFTTTLTHNLKENAKSDFKSLKSEIVDLSNKEWYKKYDDANSLIFDYLYRTYKIRINHKT
ncbi:DUF2663 family protein [Litchfieldia salsa]|uniref:Uncharacterized protein n=1 Tax=Litchfieldia salsa TaxID=930152 RepID=A0A1H0T8W5_9BACI|nr:DUF2663 family protein [Litchfieldia salsa]SDP50464.1 Protein of unknown function [Litchfieldia salsa]